jgi:argininosuccinate synthase
MKALNRDEMMTWLKSKGVQVIGTTEEFYGTDENKGIWVSGEGSDLFDYYRESWYNSHGVQPKLNEQTEKRGWYYEWHDVGTMMLWPD